MMINLTDIDLANYPLPDTEDEFQLWDLIEICQHVKSDKLVVDKLPEVIPEENLSFLVDYLSDFYLEYHVYESKTTLEVFEILKEELLYSEILETFIATYPSEEVEEYLVSLRKIFDCEKVDTGGFDRFLDFEFDEDGDID